MNIHVSVVGLGKLGLCFAGLLARRGFTTTGVDVDSTVVDKVNSGIAPFFEPGLGELMAEVGGKSLTATLSHAEAIGNTDVTFLLVGTPSKPDGTFSTVYLESAAEGLARALALSRKPYHLFVVGSTVKPGSTYESFVSTIEQYSGRRLNEGFGVCYDPEFVALGDVLKGFLNPEVVMIGQSEPRAGDILVQIHEKLCANNPPVVRMSIPSAEVAKVALNAYITTKISFVNLLGNICDGIPGANVDDITRAIGRDRRISPYYFRSGLGYGGPCFPRDTRAFTALARQTGCSQDLINAVESVNVDQGRRLLDLVETYVSTGTTIGVLGVAFKPRTSFTLCSPMVDLISALLESRRSVIAFDPLAGEQARTIFGDRIGHPGTAADCIAQADVIVIGNPDDSFKHAAENYDGAAEKVFIDCWRILDRSKLADSVQHVQLGARSEFPETRRATVMA